jgi:hypothetical protein
MAAELTLDDIADLRSVAEGRDARGGEREARSAAPGACSAIWTQRVHLEHTACSAAGAR